MFGLVDLSREIFNTHYNHLFKAEIQNYCQLQTTSLYSSTLTPFLKV